MDRLEVKDPERVSFITQTTLSLDETQDIVARLTRAFPENSRSGGAGYLLRDGKPATCGEGCGAAVPGAAGGRFPEQFEFAAAGGGLRKDGRAGLSDRRFERSETGMAEHIDTVAVTAGASAPENLVEELIASLQKQRLRPSRRDGNQGGRRALQSACGTWPYGAAAARFPLMSPSLQVADALATACAQAARRAVGYMLDSQHQQGYWWADLTADTTLESDFILLELWRHPPQNGVWNPPTPPVDRQGRPLHSCPAVARWRIQYLRRRDRRKSTRPSKPTPR